MDHWYRFYAHVWTREGGHQDKRYLMTGESPENAYIKLCAALRCKLPTGMVIALKAFEKLENRP